MAKNFYICFVFTIIGFDTFYNGLAKKIVQFMSLLADIKEPGD